MHQNNKLIKRTIENIDKRKSRRRIQYDYFSLIDTYIRRAVEEYNKGKSVIISARNFFRRLKNLLQIYQKKNFMKYFNDFIINEIDLDVALKKHEAHFDHVIQVFFLGYNIITKWNYLLEKYDLDEREDNFYFFRNFFFSWFSASLLHDHGYLIEKAERRIEKIRASLDKFGLTCFQFKLKPIRWKFLHNLFNELRNVSRISLDQFKQLFQFKNKDGKLTWDHGLISANHYIEMLEEAKREYLKQNIQEKKEDLIFLEWISNQNSILAMLLHNFKMIKSENLDFHFGLELSCSDSISIIAHILMVCDDIQIWGRKKLLKNLFPNVGVDKILKSIRLLDCKFESDKAYIKVLHQLNEGYKKVHYEEIISKKLLKTGSKFPNCVFLKDEKVLNNGMLQNLKNQKDIILKPQSNGKAYEIFVDHLINGSFFASVVYKL